MKQLEPKYTYKEDLINSLTHLISFFVIIAFSFFIKDISFELIIYLMCLEFTFMSSTIYHLSQAKSQKGKLRKLDHASIYLTFLGTFLLYNGFNLGFILGVFISLIGFYLVYLDVEKARFTEYFLYLLLLIIFFFNFKYPNNYFYYGTIVYILGFISYNIGRYKRGFHALWHVLSLIGAIIHIVGVL